MMKPILTILIAFLAAPAMAQDSNTSHCKKAEEEDKLKTGNYDECVCFYTQVDKHLSPSIKSALMTSQLTGEDTISKSIPESELIALGPKMEKIREDTDNECKVKPEVN